MPPAGARAVMAGVLGLATLACSSALAQPTAAPSSPSVPASNSLPAEPALRPDGVPTPAASMRAFAAVERWVRALEAPKELLKDQAEDGLVACAGASVQLRLEGKLIGRGSAYTLDANQQKDVVLRAARAAIAEARSRLPGDRDALFEQRARELARSIVISLELAGTPVPIDLDDWSQAAQRVNPGVDGVAARIGDRVEAMFPVAMLCTQTEPAAALQGLVSRLGSEPGLGLVPLADLKTKHGVVFYRVPANHVAQTKPGGSAQFLHRGGRVFPDTMGTTGLSIWGDQLAWSLLSRLAASNEHTALASIYNPVLGKYDLDPASPYEHALAVYAISLFRSVGIATHQSAVNWSGLGGQDGPLQRILEAMPEVDRVETPGVKDPEFAAFTTLLLDQVWLATPRVRPYEIGCFGGTMPDSRILDVRKAASLDLLNRSVESIETFPLRSQAVLAMVGPQVIGPFKPKPERELLTPEAEERWTRVLAGVYSRIGTDRLSVGMPWLAYASARGVPLGNRRQGPITACVALGGFRDLVWTHQFTPESLDASRRDLAGAINFMNNPASLPTWHAANTLAGLAILLPHDDATPPEQRARHLAKLLNGLRFLRQLTADDDAKWMYSEPIPGWGVRASPWDQRMPIEATAMTLIAVSETIRSLDELAKRDAAAKP